MPIVIKPNVNVNNAMDGFDPEIPYQMVPFGGEREIAVQTGDFKAEMSFTKPDVSSMSNFRILQQKSPTLFPLPGPGNFVNRITLPAQSLLLFTLSGRGAGTTTLEGRDSPGQGVPQLQPDFRLEVSVKLAGIRRFAVCYVFDQINRDSGRRVGFGSMFRDISQIYKAQANFTIVNIDGDLSSSSAARTLTIAGTLGTVFNLDDARLVARVINGFETNFPSIFSEVDAVVFPVPVPLRTATVAAFGVQARVRRRSDGKRFQTIFLGSELNTDPVRLRLVLAHEIGHSFGLNHRPATEPPGPSPKTDPDPDVLPVFMHNLMFPVPTLMRSTRLNGRQIDDIHSFIPPFRNIEI